MEKLKNFTGVAAPLDMANVDTDMLVPKQFLKRVQKSGYGQFLFYNQRFLADGSPDPGFVLNEERYQGASILLGRENFGSGSSREHAPWALLGYGIKMVIAPSFADIFKNNSFKNGLLLIELESQIIDEWFKRVAANPGYAITLDLSGQTLTGSDGFACSFGIDPFKKRCFMEGLDEIGLTLQKDRAIKDYEATHAAPWQAAVSGEAPA